MAKQKTYKEWVDYHYKKLKKQMPEASDQVLKMMAADAASSSMKLQGGTTQGSMSQSATGTNFGTNRVGPGASPMPIPTPSSTTPVTLQPSALSPTKKAGATPTPSPTPTVTANPPGGVSYNDRIVARIKASGTAYAGPYIYYNSTGSAASYDMPTFLRNLTTADYVALQAQLKRLGYSTKNKEEINQTLIQVFPQYFPTTDLKTLLAKLKEQELPGAGGDGTANLPQRLIRPVDRGTLVEIANTVAKDVLMMDELPRELLDKVVNAWEKKAGKGTLQATKKVRNPKTGKMEEVTTITGGFQQQAEEQKLAQTLKTTMPQQAQLAEGIGFADELKRLLAGGM